MSQVFWWVCVWALAVSLQSCAPYYRAKLGQPLQGEELQHWLRAAKDPRRFWITVQADQKGPVFEGHNRLHPNQLAALDFVSCSDVLLPIIEYDGWWWTPRFTALIDTTAAYNWVTLDTFRQLQGELLGSPVYRLNPVHVTETQPGYAGVITKLRFDSIHVENCLVSVWPVGGKFQSVGRHTACVPDMILGMDFLKRFRYVQVDYLRRRVLLSTSYPYRPDPQRVMAALPYGEIAGALAVYATIDTEIRPVLLDTAGDFSVVWTNEAGIIRQLELGTLVFRNVEAENAAAYRVGLPQYARIGLKLLSQFCVTMDNANRMVYFERGNNEKVRR